MFPVPARSWRGAGLGQLRHTERIPDETSPLSAVHARAAMLQPGGTAGVLLEGITLRLQADLRWLDACERQWSGNAKEPEGS